MTNQWSWSEINSADPYSIQHLDTGGNIRHETVNDTLARAVAVAVARTNAATGKNFIARNYSGGQPGKGTGRDRGLRKIVGPRGNRTGSVRHDYGNAIDLHFFSSDGARIDNLYSTSNRNWLDTFAYEIGRSGIIKGFGQYKGNGMVHVGLNVNRSDENWIGKGVYGDSRKIREGVIATFQKGRKIAPQLGQNPDAQVPKPTFRSDVLDALSRAQTSPPANIGRSTQPFGPDSSSPQNAAPIERALPDQQGFFPNSTPYISPSPISAPKGLGSVGDPGLPDPTLVHRKGPSPEAQVYPGAFAAGVSQSEPAVLPEPIVRPVEAINAVSTPGQVQNSPPHLAGADVPAPQGRPFVSANATALSSQATSLTGNPVTAPDWRGAPRQAPRQQFGPVGGLLGSPEAFASRKIGAQIAGLGNTDVPVPPSYDGVSRAELSSADLGVGHPGRVERGGPDEVGPAANPVAAVFAGSVHGPADGTRVPSRERHSTAGIPFATRLSGGVSGGPNKRAQSIFGGYLPDDPVHGVGGGLFGEPKTRAYTAWRGRGPISALDTIKAGPGNPGYAGSGSKSIQGIMSGRAPAGFSAASRSTPGTSVTSLGPAGYAYTSTGYAYTDVTNPDGTTSHHPGMAVQTTIGPHGKPQTSLVAVNPATNKAWGSKRNDFHKGWQAKAQARYAAAHARAASKTASKATSGLGLASFISGLFGPTTAIGVPALAVATPTAAPGPGGLLGGPFGSGPSGGVSGGFGGGVAGPAFGGGAHSNTTDAR